MITIPTLLTLGRIVAIPVFMIAFYLPVSWGHLLAATVFALACFTDWLDGYIARHLAQVTRFGAFLDPVADKLTVAVALVLIVGEAHHPLLTIPAAIIVGREIVISALREWMAEIGKRTSVAVSMIGKIKTALQMTSLFLLLLYSPHAATNSALLKISGILLLNIAAILTLWSMIMYLKTAWQDLTLTEEK